MGLPRNKAELIAGTRKERDALADMLAGMTPAQLLWPGEYGWSAKDHVAHLAEWERMVQAWYDAGLRGENPSVPAEGRTWADLSAINNDIYLLHRDEGLDHVMSDWRYSSDQLLRMMDWASEMDLFSVGRFPWAGRGTLAAFIWECGGGHYHWAAEQIKRGLKYRR